MKKITGSVVWTGRTLARGKGDKAGTISRRILQAHNRSRDPRKLEIAFDELVSHDITYVGIIQTAKASGLEKFPLPYTLTNCHNSLCAVGGTINEDDHVFGLSAVKKYGGIYVPAHVAVIHQYMREARAFSGGMILGSDSHTRYGALGALAVGEGGPELVKQLLGRTYDVNCPEIIAVELRGKLRPGVGPHDVALALVKEVFPDGFVKNKILEFVGTGIGNLSVDERNGIDVMTTETACLSSVWTTDEKVRAYYADHGREEAYRPLEPAVGAEYDGGIVIDLSRVEPMIALPFHPSNAYTIRDFLSRPYELLKKAEDEGKKLLADGNFCLTDKIRGGKVYADQGVIAGCAGGLYENIAAASEILGEKAVGSEAFTLDVYPASQPVYKGLADAGYIGRLTEQGAVVKTAFCGPCFGAGDVPAHNGLSLRHTTRNFENREGSRPADGQLAAVALMDARSIAATALNGGAITPATEVFCRKPRKKYRYDGKIYAARVYRGNADSAKSLIYGPNIADWPQIPPLKENLLLNIASVLTDPVTTTDELIPSGETSSYRSNPHKLAEFALSRKDPGYVARAKAVRDGAFPAEGGYDAAVTTYASAVCAVKPGDGSAREQAASCQRVLGGGANIAADYATKRYRSNLINWGMFPFRSKEAFAVGELVYIPDARALLLSGACEFPAETPSGRRFVLTIDPLTETERRIIADGCLINYYKNEGKKKTGSPV